MAAKKSEKMPALAETAVGVSTTPVAKAARVRKPPAAKVTAVVAAEAVAVVPVAPRMPDASAIRDRAHELFLVRGGSALDNWLQAERELGAGPA